MHLLSIKRGNTEIYRNFESRFASSVANLNSHAQNALTESLTAFILLENSNIDSNQRNSILSAAAASSRSDLRNLLPLTD